MVTKKEEKKPHTHKGYGSTANSKHNGKCHWLEKGIWVEMKYTQ
jgi:hypothetical protein